MTLSSDSGDLVAKLQVFVDKIPFAESFNMKVVDAKRGSVKLSIDPKPALFNHFGTYQAGVYFTAAEITGGLVCGTFLDLSNHLLITQKSSISFEHATNEPLILTAEVSEEAIDGKVIPTLTIQRKTILPVNIFVKTPSGQVIAECQSDYYLRLGIPKIFIPTNRA